jgi:transcriptional regulator GlxA family with amidase domain
MVASVSAIPARVCAAARGHFIAAYAAACSSQLIVVGSRAAQDVGSPVPVIDHTGRCQLIAVTTLAELTRPMSWSSAAACPRRIPTGKLMQWLRQVHPTTAWTTSVCTGSICLAAAGILGGQDASTHWARAEQLERWSARCTEQRVVERAKVITAAGVSAGIDMALTLLARIHGPQHAQMIQLAIEYDPARPSTLNHRPRHRPDGGLRAIIAYHAAMPPPPGGL